MEAEVIKLAQAGVMALQAGPPPNWAESAGVIVSGVVGLGQITAIGLGLWIMSRNGDRPAISCQNLPACH